MRRGRGTPNATRVEFFLIMIQKKLQPIDLCLMSNLGVSARTADTWWAYARAWLSVELKENEPLLAALSALLMTQVRFFESPDH
jgi:hypothetical protein